MNDTPQDLQQIIQDHLTSLPPVVQKAIASSEIQANLRKLSETHKLHVDQWESLEEEVMMTLLGIDPIEELQQNIVSEVGVDTAIALQLTQDINTIVFEPIREELERQLEHPEAQQKEVSGVEAAKNAALATVEPTSAAAPAVAPATPPASAPEVKVAKPIENPNYKPGETSAQRAVVHDDPYREPPL